MLNKLRLWLIETLINGEPYVANITLIHGLAIDADVSQGGNYSNICVKQNHNEKIPDAAFYFARNVKYFE